MSRAAARKEIDMCQYGCDSLRSQSGAAYPRRRALAALTSEVPGDTAELGWLLTSLAAIDALQHNTSEAEARCRQAMAMLDRAGRGQSREWISAANNLATLLFETGKPEQGEHYM